jgi:methyltransferase
MHAVFFVACAAAAVRTVRPPSRALTVAALLVLAAAQGLRWWAILSLRERWTTSVVTLPSAAPIVTGPYRYLRHPNYLAVVLELAAVPLVFGSWRTALAFTALNGIVLSVRIAVEERALGADWQRAFEDRPRLVPRRRRDAA